MKKTVSFIAAFFLAAALCAVILTAVIDGAGTSGSVLLRGFRKYAPAEGTGLPEGEYPAVSAMTADYLAGNIKEFQLLSADGEPLFNSREQQHMEDCRQLFALCRRVNIISAILAAVLAVLCALTGWMKTRQFAIGLSAGFSSLMLVFAVGAVMCFLNFDSMFVLFHKAAFSNDLWLMDPATDLIIRLMPTEFFISLARAGGIVFGTMVLILDTVSIILACRRKRK